MYINSDYIAAELLASVPVLEAILEGLNTTELEDEEVFLILILFGVGIAMLYTFETAEFSSSDDTTEAFIVSLIEGVLLACTTCFCEQLFCSEEAETSKTK